MAEKTQLVVLGGGPGGYAAAFLAADLGVQTTIVDMEKNPGGVCLYRGCIPSKALLHVARLLNEAEEAKAWGIDFPKPAIDVDKLRGYKESVVTKLTSGLGQLSKQRKVTYIQGRGKFVNNHTLTIDKADGTTQELEFEKIIIATGSFPTRIPSLFIDSPRVLDSTGALNLENVPETMLAIGGGYIGLELSSVYASLGSKVTVVEMTPGLLPGADRDLASVLNRKIQSRYKKIYLSTKVTKLEDTGHSIKVTLEGEDVDTPVQEFEKVLISIGRTPNSKGLGLENTKVKVSDRGFIEVDAQQRTAEPHIFAIGDVVGNPMLAHKASAEGRVAAEVIAGHAKAVFEPAAIPAVVFTDPELAWVGITEAEAREKGIEHKVAKYPWAASGRAMSIDRTEGMTKVIIDPKTERILGVGIVGAGAGELIAEGALAIEMAATANDLGQTIHPHPTLSETLKGAAEVYFGHATDIYRPKR